MDKERNKQEIQRLKEETREISRQMHEKQREFDMKRGKVPRVQEDNEDDKKKREKLELLEKFWDDTDSEADGEEEKGGKGNNLEAQGEVE